jgi:hypothetical protein
MLHWMQNELTKEQRHHHHHDDNRPTIFMIRHGEKPPKDRDGYDPVGLSEDGQIRADALSAVFGKDSGYNIQYIMAQRSRR